MATIFTNCTNHELTPAQVADANQRGWINGGNVPFPQVPETATSSDIDKMAEELADALNGADVVLLQGQMVLVYRTVNILKRRGKRVYAAMTRRNVVEKINDDGTVTKTAVFEHAGFMEY